MSDVSVCFEKKHFPSQCLQVDTPVRGQAPGRIQLLRAFRRSAPRLSVVGRCLDFKAVGLFGELQNCPGHQLTSEAHRRWSHRGTAKSRRSGVICCRGAWFLGLLVDTKIGVYQGGRACGQAAARPQTGSCEILT